MAATLAETRRSTLRFSRRSDCYEPLDQVQREEEQEEEDEGRRSWGTVSKKQMMRSRGSSRGALGWSSLSYRRERARRRLVFLQSYKLQQEPRTRSEKLRKVVAGAVKSALVSIASFRRMGSCGSKSSASAQVIRCC
ncbi:unnamed protein product [Cuscuta campestris]|uniref:Uncharacterized protein n=2 Tax=Cuscuta sect. Cleistogrammica TaxID=1824901 RepID=A0A484KI96_9ASTE|nr:hypothetical protein DM860_014743 [Cuscuta australis]VFQ61802.1 unnamed protein product [Cuscuta campestris]